MIVAYLFTFLLVILIVLFLLVPFLRQGKSTSAADPADVVFEDDSPREAPLDLGRAEDNLGQQANSKNILSSHDVTSHDVTTSDVASHDVEIEVAVTQARRRISTFSNKCSQCGHPMQTGDRFCASCGTPVQSS